jgi:hypothetical protein
MEAPVTTVIRMRPPASRPRTRCAQNRMRRIGFMTGSDLGPHTEDGSWKKEEPSIQGELLETDAAVDLEVPIPLHGIERTAFDALLPTRCRRAPLPDACGFTMAPCGRRLLVPIPAPRA